MPCSVPATSVSCRRRPNPFASNPPKFAAVLDLSKPGEKSAHDFLLRATSGRLPLFRVLSVNRRDSSLLVAIESCQGSPFVLSLSLQTNTLSLRQWYRSHDEAKQAIATDTTQRAVYVTFARLLRERREKLGLSRHRLAQLARVSETTLRNLETARVTPLRRTLESLRRVKALDLSFDDLPPWRDFGCSLRVGGLLALKPKKPHHGHGPASGEHRGQSHGE